MRKVKATYKAVYEPIADLVTYRALPTNRVSMNHLDPFIFLNHHGRQEYPPHNNGLPFGPHPHRGFETVTFILEGDLTHKDSSGAASVIKAGGVQWMTAGSGLVHAEISSEEFKENGGPLEILQLWINLPARHKMANPKYTGLQKEEIPVATWDDEKVTAQIVSGNWNGVQGNIQPLTDISLACIHFKKGGKTSFNIPVTQTIFLYVVKGQLTINNEAVRLHHLVDFEHNDEALQIEATTDAVILLGYATPFNEPLIAHGPFVMNTREEIMQAYDDYNKGKFGDAATLLD
jgi:redox-sensitive bicupin YhaK (pirin superfamily)